jgi:hypothetical protein
MACGGRRGAPLAPFASKCTNKLAALVVLGKYLGMFDERPQNTNAVYAISVRAFPQNTNAVYAISVRACRLLGTPERGQVRGQP